MPKPKTSEKIFLVRIFEMFPVEDPIAIDILRLMFGCNDIYLVEQWANGTKATPTNKGAQVITTGRNTLQLRLLCSFLIVSLEVLDALTKRPGFEALRLLLTDEGQLALSKLLEIRLAKFEFSTEELLPDLWAITRDHAAASSEANLERFSEAERDQIKLGLATFRVLIIQNFDPDPGQLEAVSQRLDYLSAAVDRLNKFDWKGVALSTLIGISTTLTLDTDKGRQLYGLFQQALSSLMHLLR